MVLTMAAVAANKGFAPERLTVQVEMTTDDSAREWACEFRTTIDLGAGLDASLVEEDSVAVAQGRLAKSGGKIILPTDVVVADAFSADAVSKTVPVKSVPAGWRILDIGPKTVKAFVKTLKGAQTVVWNGPMGVFEVPRFAEGTFAVARALAELPGATTIIGGGDSAAAVEQAGVADKVSHVSTGGGASLEFLEGKTLPGVATLEDK